MKNLRSVSVQVIDSDIALLLPNGVYEIKQMEPKSSRLKQITIFCIALAVSGILGFGYFCPDRVCALNNREIITSVDDNLGKPLTRPQNKVGLSYDDMINDDFAFRMDSHDVMVFLHMQKTGCYNKDYVADRDRIMLASAKKNLQSMAFFGLTEYQKVSQYIFEETFNLRFAIPFEQNNSTASSSTMPTLTPTQAAKVASLNNLDIELYKFAKELMWKRFEKLKSGDSDFEERFKHLGELTVKNGVTEFDWERLEDPTQSSE